MRTVNFTEARNHLKTVLDQVVEDTDYTVISRRDTEDAVVMSLSQFNGWMETMYLLRSPANAKHLAESIAQVEAGKVKDHPLIDD
ncbi:MAG: type II toxin-antitoxin system prevent-host-death family antitoxin [Candidatus Thioglobus sp.]|nr:type II toxin-antitoxin system prevent-host-death family antitoxin [Candidatus Thioglobus pontius]MBL6976506.1 type II toxin-antitoxin system prevent-host-death family antitoxin [Candidatus Thioglobus sp.]MBL6984007.1 type II toxin-antitoxin system prevent-host-death family antitoxin [Candidatus Thioglobus sp.]